MKPPTTVKVCGVTLPEQAEAMLRMGVSLIGVNFVPSSPRRLTPEAASAIVRTVGDPQRVVGVFQEATTEWVEECIARSGIGMLQFHGFESTEFCERFGLPWIRVVHAGPEFDPSRIGAGSASWLLFDSRKGCQLGGTGTSFDWSTLKSHKFSKPWMLAGGLGPHNIADAMRELHPYGVDLNSKIEAGQPGIKDLAALQSCLDAIHAST